MGWIDSLKRLMPKGNRYASMLNGFTPIYSQFGQNIYASDVVQQCIVCITSEMKKLSPTHIRQDGQDVIPVSGNRQRVLNQPNAFMSTSDFLEKITWNLFFNYNSWIIPTYDVWTDDKGKERRSYKALYPVQPTMVEFQENAAGRLYVKLSFANNFETTLPYDDVIHIRYKYSVNDFMGGNASGQPDNEALLKTLQLNHELLNGVSKAMKSSYAINGVVKYNTLIDDGKTLDNVKELEQKLSRGESGFLPLDLKADFTPIKRDIQLVDSNTLKFIDEKILRNFGVPLCILIGDYTKQQYEAFYQKTLEPMIKSFGETPVLNLPEFTQPMNLIRVDITTLPRNGRKAVQRELSWMNVTARQTSALSSRKYRHRIPSKQRQHPSHRHRVLRAARVSTNSTRSKHRRGSLPRCFYGGHYGINT